MKTKYITDDGTEFDDFCEAREYEIKYGNDKFATECAEKFSRCHFYDDDLNEISFLELKYKHVRCMEFDTVDNLKLLKKHSGFFKFYSGIDIEHIPASRDKKRLWNIKDNGDYEFVTVFGIKGRIEHSRRVIKENEQIISELNRAIAFFDRNEK